MKANYDRLHNTDKALGFRKSDNNSNKNNNNKKKSNNNISSDWGTPGGVGSKNSMWVD